MGYAGVNRGGGPVPDRDEPTALPPAVALVRDFVNTREPQVGEDELTAPARLREWCAARGLVTARARLDDRDLEDAICVREGLRVVLLAHAGHDPDAAAIDR